MSKYDNAAVQRKLYCGYLFNIKVCVNFVLSRTVLWDYYVLLRMELNKVNHVFYSIEAHKTDIKYD